MSHFDSWFKAISERAEYLVHGTGNQGQNLVGWGGDKNIGAGYKIFGQRANLG